MQTFATVVLSVAEYDIFAAQVLEHELLALDGGAATVDFCNVRYIDSTALGVFVRTLKRLRTADPASTMRFVNVKPAVRRLFEITALTDIFQIDQAA